MNQYMDRLTVVSQKQDNGRSYQAWRRSKEGREFRLQIRYEVGKHVTVPYISILLVQYLAPSKLSIFCNHCIIHITGKNLGELDTLLQADEVQVIRRFNARHFDEPAAHEGKITDITIEWQREEMRQEEEVNQSAE